MLGGGSNNPGNGVDWNVLRRRIRYLISRLSIEKTHPGNLEFQRQLAAALEAATQEYEERQNQMSAVLRAGVPYWNILSTNVEDGESPVPWMNVFELPAGPSAPFLLVKAGTQQGEERLKDSAKPPDDSDFLEGTFLKINSDEQKATRNKKNRKKKGKKGKGRKQLHASEIKSEPSSPTKPSSTCADAAGGEALSTSSHVAVSIPQLEYNTSSSSLVTELLINPVNSAYNSANENELSSSSDDEFKSFDCTTSSYSTAASSSVNDYYTGGKNAWINNTMDDYAGSMSDARQPLSASGCIDSRGFKKRSDEGSKPNDHQSFSIAIGPGGSQEGSLCRDDASNAGEFQKVISRKAAQKMKKMQHLESPAIAASGPTMTRTLVPSAPRRGVITMGHYIKEDCIYGRKPNHKIKGKNQKAPSLSNVSKTGYTDGENVPGSSRKRLVTVHTGKPGSHQMALSSTSRHHVTLEDIEEASSPGCLPMEGELKASVVGDTERTDSTALSSDKTSSLGNLADSSCVDREELEKSMVSVAVGGDTEGTDSTATSSDKTLSQLGHLANSSCVNREEQKKDMAPVSGDSSDTKDTDSIAPSSDKTSASLGHLSNSSCVKREQLAEETRE